MHVTYFDEVKANPANGQSFYIVGGISLPMADIANLEASVSRLADEIFGSSELTPETEFHASHIYFGKGPFKGMPPKQRIDLLVRLAELIAHGSNVRRMYAAINTNKLYVPEKAAEFAFAHFCERANRALGPKTVSILIGDQDDQESKKMIHDFAIYRQSGTPWAFGLEIKRLTDTVHFAKSHYSRMIQLADLYVFAVASKYGGRQGWMADAFMAALKEKDLHANSYKEWPRD